MVFIGQIICLMRHTKVFLNITAYGGVRGGGILTRILTCLHCTKYNEFNICHSDVQKYVSYTWSHKDSGYIMSYAKK